MPLTKGAKVVYTPTTIGQAISGDEPTTGGDGRAISGDRGGNVSGDAENGAGAARETVCAAVIGQIKSAVRSNQYPPGTRLPSERALAEQLGISYSEMEKEYLQKVSLRRMVSPHDVAAMVLFLLSPLGENISGQSLGVDGNVETL